MGYFENPFAKLSYPEEWHDQVSERKSVVKSYNISNYYNYHRNYYKNNKVVNSKENTKILLNIEDDKKTHIYKMNIQVYLMTTILIYIMKFKIKT